MWGWPVCDRCGTAHPPGACPPSAAPSQPAAETPDPRFFCVACYRPVSLDDVAVLTPRGRALCVRCSRGPA
jgi:hypothetical protein